MNEIPLLENLKRLTPLDILVLGIVGFFTLYWFVKQKIHYLSLILILSAAFNGSTIPIIDNLASLTRWIILFIFFGLGFLQRKLRISIGILLWWAYVFLGVIFVLRANYLLWQFQRSVLLLMVSIAIPFTFSGFNYQKFRQSFAAISVAASVFSVVNFLPFADSLVNPARFQGYLKGAATFAVVLGGLLPFMFWGLLKGQSRLIKMICLGGFICGFITLAFTGQRTGTIAGFISIIPIILLTLVSRRRVIWIIFIIILLSFLSSYFIKQTSLERINFLLFRYSASSGLSYREIIWRAAVAEIAQNPYVGWGVGAAETVISASFHNAYLEVWFNTGWLGLACFLFSQLYFTWRGIYLILFGRNNEVKPILAVSVGYLVSFMLMGLVESTGATASSVNLILFLMVGVFVSCSPGLGLEKKSKNVEQIPIPSQLQLRSLEKNLG